MSNEQRRGIKHITEDDIDGICPRCGDEHSLDKCLFSAPLIPKKEKRKKKEKREEKPESEPEESEESD